jgi:hypothetical protein
VTDFETAVACASALASVAVVAFAWLWARRDAARVDIVRQDRTREAAREHREAMASADAERAARRAAGPQDGTLLGVHVGSQVIRGTRVLRDAAEADGWLVLEDASLLEGRTETALGGRQWIAGAPWIQELERK